MKISKQNSKLGKIENISLVPVRDCLNCDECRNDCYALKAYKQYKTTRIAWNINSKLARQPETMRDNLREYFNNKKRKPKYFRIHVAGDFISQDYLNVWITTAKENPETRFLAFTKSHDLDYSDKPDNFVIIFSQWPNQPVKKGSINAWIETDERKPSNYFLCLGGANKDAIKCDSCGYCFDNPQKDIVFPFH